MAKPGYADDSGSNVLSQTKSLLVRLTRANIDDAFDNGKQHTEQEVIYA